jgi:hypothetical protein
MVFSPTQLSTVCADHSLYDQIAITLIYYNLKRSLHSPWLAFAHFSRALLLT